MSMGGALFALTAVQAVNSIAQGYAQKAEANFNATLLEGKANMIDAQSEIEYGQYNRLKGQTMSKSVAAIAGAGIGLQGSAMAVMIDAQAQINIDQAIGQFNYKQDKNYTIAQANAARRAGKNAVTSGWVGGLTNVLQGASNYAMYNNKTSFDMGGGGRSQYGNTYGSNTPKGTIDTGTYSKLYYKG